MDEGDATAEIAGHAQRARDQIADLDRLGVREGTQVYIAFNAFSDRRDDVERMRAALGDCSCRITVAYSADSQREIWGELKRPPTYHLFGRTASFGYAPRLLGDRVLRIVALAEECSCCLTDDWAVTAE